jgi:hypothetical protein
MRPTSFRTGMVAWIRVSIVITILLILSGCITHIKELREAQIHFNSAAQLENQLKIDPLSSDAIAITTQVTASYQLALKMLTELIDNKKKDLQDDNLLGTAYTLKALGEWRIGKYDDAVNTVATVSADSKIKLFPRDRALMNALHGLIKNDQANGHMAARDYEYTRIKSLLQSSLNDIKNNVTGTDSIRLYLTTVQMVILKNWADLRGDPKAYSSTYPAKFDKEAEIREWCESANPAWEAFVNELKSLPEEKARAFESFWSKRLGMPGACPK